MENTRFNIVDVRKIYGTKCTWAYHSVIGITIRVTSRGVPILRFVLNRRIQVPCLRDT